jgi:hypothetical protein
MPSVKVGRAERGDVTNSKGLEASDPMGLTTVLRGGISGTLGERDRDRVRSFFGNLSARDIRITNLLSNNHSLSNSRVGEPISSFPAL